MERQGEKIPTPKELEKEIGNFLSRKFGANVKMISPVVMAQSEASDTAETSKKPDKKFHFDLKPEDLIDYLDQYVVEQGAAKAVLATKICTHFNRIRQAEQKGSSGGDFVGRIKNNVLMIGPTGVGKTYIVKLIAHKLGVPFVKGDATKFSETGYVGGDVEDLVRDLVREADDDIERAQYGIIYIDEIDKIASSRNHIGADVSRTGVQRALLKPMEETEVDLKVPHDPISMFQEIERYRKTGSRQKRAVNTRNILFIMSGAFSELTEIIKRRIQKSAIGFGAAIRSGNEWETLLDHVKSEDLIAYGFESEFVGRLPVRTVFNPLNEQHLYEILCNPNNPIILGKKLDFGAYGIAVRFSDEALRLVGRKAADENTGARGLVSAVERVLMPFERHLPSTGVRRFPVTAAVIREPERALQEILDETRAEDRDRIFQELDRAEQDRIRTYLETHLDRWSLRFPLAPTPARLNAIARVANHSAVDLQEAIDTIQSEYDDIKKMELYFYKSSDINIVLEEDAIDSIIEQRVEDDVPLKTIYKKLREQFEDGLRLVKEKTGRSRFFITRESLQQPEPYIAGLLKNLPEELESKT
ncbi:MAG: AAA family ATPase [Desulfobacteraceae bacterium]|jgi:endopeptidase Clp ATP-binding regulatory subunit ClpX|nr:AAA family ATPase [Desulfobacteraceae bacterium]